MPSHKARPIWTYDTETDPFSEDQVVPEPFIFGVYEGEKEIYHEFNSLQELIDFFNSEYAQKQRPIIYAHNGGKFADYHVLRASINSDERIMIINGRLAKFRIGDCEFRDSINILPVALSAFQKEEVDYSIFTKEKRTDLNNMYIIRMYLRSDCINLYTFVKKFQDRFGKGLTQAGASLRYWSKNYDVKPPKMSAHVHETLKPFYYGGRVQCFKSGDFESDFKIVDINSAYPRAMLEQHPFSSTPTITTKLPKDSEVAQCLIRLDATADGCFPLRHKNGLYFPSDEKEVREYFITGWEYLAALENNAVKNITIKEVFQFSEKIDFKKYILDAYQHRREAQKIGDKANDILDKLLMNSLYGKFASDSLKYKEYLLSSDEKYSEWLEAGYQDKAEWGERKLLARSLPIEKHRYYNVATAASITGYVRAFLFSSMRKCRGLIYCDTDSITAEDVSGLDLGEGLGQWKLELNCDRAVIAGKKMYAKRSVSIAAAVAEKKHLQLCENNRWWKVACKGADLSPDEIISVTKVPEGASAVEKFEFKPQVPTYSVLKPTPFFVNRKLSRTAKDISRLP